MDRFVTRTFRRATATRPSRGGIPGTVGSFPGAIRPIALLFVACFLSAASGFAEAETMASEATHTNRLIDEKSPYLLQHAHNPVAWYPWGPEALARARDEDKPIFLSIGYSTCHWCHVMAHESFENDDIAAILNEHFVAIKVDREERPDLDKLYMSAVQALTGRGGWPMSLFLTPDREPFFGGTYFPPEDRWGRPGFKSLLNDIANAWREDRPGLLQSATSITAFLLSASGTPRNDSPAADPTAELLAEAFGQLKDRFDPRQGGFGEAPKFPTPHNLTFLMRYAHRTGDAQALEMVTATLDAMASGGIHDHLAGGFHRYSTDEHWLVPHFEKMLYDQAGLALAYSGAWLVTGDTTYAAVTRDILDYVLAYLRDPGGAFYSAEDADSEGEEGTFYVWTVDEITDLLGAEIAGEFNRTFGVSSPGNWEGKNILNRDAARPALNSAMINARDQLRVARDKRPRPHRDEKIVTAWNGYMIEALARAGQALQEPRYVQAAEAAAQFIEAQLWRDGRLLRYHRGAAADIPGFIDDYAFLGRGLLALYEATFQPRYLQAALHLAHETKRLFHRPHGGFDFAGIDTERLLAPVVEIHDGAMPSGNSAASVLLLRIGHLTANVEIETLGREVLQSFAARVRRAPASHLEMLSALDFALGPVTEVVIATPGDDPTTDPAAAALLASLWSRYLPNTVTAAHTPASRAKITALIPYVASQAMIAGRPTAYVCRDYACRLPVHDGQALARQLDGD
jgi:uncharacterized protein YyaL (SSP411 family)